MGTHHKGSVREVRALNAYIKLIRAAESVTRRLTPVLTAAGLTVSQFGTLEALYHLGPMKQKEIGAKILKSSGNITMVIDNLEKRGLVNRVRDRSDRRVVTVNLTLKGRRLIEEVFPLHLEGIIKEMRRLTGEEQQKLGEFCRRLGRGEELS